MGTLPLSHALEVIFFLKKPKSEGAEYEQQPRNLFAHVLPTSLTPLFSCSFAHSADLGGVEGIKVIFFVGICIFSHGVAALAHFAQ